MNENTNITDIISAALAAGCQISVTMLIPPDTPVGTRTIIIPQGFTLAEHRIIREAIADALADHGEEL